MFKSTIMTQMGLVIMHIVRALTVLSTYISLSTLSSMEINTEVDNWPRPSHW